MRLHFKPMPWLTILSVLGFVFLLKLGFWQKDRLAWKLDVLDRVEAAAEAPPFTSLSDVIEALNAGDPVDYRRFQARATQVEQFKYWVYGRYEESFGFRDFSRVSLGNKMVYKAHYFSVPDPSDLLLKIKLGPFVEKDVDISGYIRLAPKAPTGLAKMIKTKPNAKANRWFAFNQDNLWDSKNTDMRFYIDSHGSDLTKTLPALRPDIRNNHWEYMWTWFSMAGLLVIFYILLHHRAGRLKLS